MIAKIGPQLGEPLPPRRVVDREFLGFGEDGMGIAEGAPIDLRFRRREITFPEQSLRGRARLLAVELPR